MYYTRQVFKRIKFNDDVETRDPVCFLPSAGPIYWGHLGRMADRNPGFDPFVYHQHQEVIQSWFILLRRMTASYSFDNDYLRNVFYPIYCSSWIEEQHGIHERMADRRKVGWIFNNLVNNPVAIKKLQEALNI